MTINLDLLCSHEMCCAILQNINKTHLYTIHLHVTLQKIDYQVCEKRMCHKKNVEKQRFDLLVYSPDYTYSLDDSEKLKHLQIVRTLVEIEAVKNYRPPEITSAVKEYVTETLDLRKSVKESKCKEVSNIKLKVHSALNTHLIGNLKLELDICEMVSFFEKQEYKVQHFKITSQST
ncbi:4529_t:CDS:2 [Cetraspora pellucida]|uniref:4529_t:CDS:1 n=1 Tax=Cetraspora pellucida TaxID=1433469 RepID=A0A9N9P5F2_9GLOM|nr:4529_t:CDS:2 [Cetraspora pellucida]